MAEKARAIIEIEGDRRMVLHILEEIDKASHHRLYGKAKVDHNFYEL